MKILLGIVGQYRTFEKTCTNIYDNLINANPDHEFDIILNTDFCNKNIIDYWPKERSHTNYDEQTLQKKFEECYGNNLIKVINYNVNEEDIKGGSFQIFKKRINITVDYLKENSLNYQLYIFIRFDVYFINKINIEKYFNNSFNFICRNISTPSREDHHRDWDLCWIFSNLLYNDYFNNKYPNNYVFKDNLSIDELLTFSDIINFKTNYINLVKEKNEIFQHWVKGFWIKFYNMYKNKCLINFDEEYFTEIQRFGEGRIIYTA